MSETGDIRLDRTFAALSDPTRRGIVKRLLDGDATVSQLATPFDMSLAAVSKHIATLTQAGLVMQRREGRIKWCRLDIDGLHDALRWMSAFGDVETGDFERLEERLIDLGLVEDDQDQDPAPQTPDPKAHSR